MARLIRDYCDESVSEVFIDDKKFYVYTGTGATGWWKSTDAYTEVT